MNAVLSRNVSQLCPAKLQVDLEAVAEEQSQAIQKVQDAVQDALAAANASGLMAVKRKANAGGGGDDAVAKKPAAKKSKMLACLEEIEDSDEEEDSDD